MSINSANKPFSKIYSLSPMQEGMLFHAIMDPESSAYFEQMSFSIKGNFDIELFEKSFNLLIGRHEALRTNFIYQKISKPKQIVLKERYAKIYYEDITHIDVEEKQEYIKDFKKMDREKGFNLSKDLLIRMSVFKIKTGLHKVIWSYHHILMDAWCTGIVVKEFMEIYEALQKKTQFNPGRTYQFSEYISWLERQDKDIGLQYWKNYLKDYSQQAILPRNSKTCSSIQNKVIESNVIISEEVTGKLENIARHYNVTLSTVVQTIWGILLQRYNNCNDVVFGSVVSGRPPEIPGIEGIIGLFINTIPVRIKCDGSQKFTSVITDIQRDMILSDKYSYISLAEIQTNCELKHKLINNLLGFENLPVQKGIEQMGQEKKNTFEIGDVEVFEQTSYDITISIAPGKELWMIISYNPQSYDSMVVEIIGCHFGRLCEIISDNPNICISEIEILTEEERSRILNEFNQSLKVSKDRAFVELFEEQAVIAADKTAVMCKDTKVTYNELNTGANRLAHTLKEKGMGKDVIGAIMLERSPEFLEGMVSIFKAGGAYLPIDPSYPQKRIKTMLNDSKARVILSRLDLIKDMPYTSLQDINNAPVVPCTTCKRGQILDFDSLPIPDRTLIDNEKYQKYIGVGMAKNSILIQATRGCPYNCAFCHKIWPKKHVARSAENIYEEIELYYNIGIRRFVFVDDIFNLDSGNCKRLFELIIENGLKAQLYFPNGLRGDILTREFIDLMVRAGMVDLSLALESASPRIQKLIKKNLNLEKFRDNIEYITQNYPRVILELEAIIGFPGETEEEALMTLEFIKSIKWVHFVNLNVLKIYPNTDMMELALENGISMSDIERSLDLSYNQLPYTLPFSRSFASRYQAEYLSSYFLSKDRLLKVLPVQMGVLTEDEIVQKYNSYLPVDIKSINDILEFAGISEAELGEIKCVDEGYGVVEKFNEKIKSKFPAVKKDGDALRILFLDLSQYFEEKGSSMLYDMVEVPLGQMYLLTYLNKEYGSKIDGKIAKSRIDFNSYGELKELIKEFKPDIIGVRTLTYYRNFFHKTIALIRQWGIDVPIITGGPYATSDHATLLKDRNIDIAILGEGEETLLELVGKIIDNDKKLPEESVLESIAGIAYVEGKEKREAAEFAREVLLIDQMEELLEKQSAENPGTVTESGDLAYVIYTSGSTGVPKGAMVEHGGMMNHILAETEELGITGESVIAQNASQCFDISVWQFLTALTAGGITSIYTEETILEPGKLIAQINRDKVSILEVVPSYLSLMLEYLEQNPVKLEGLKYIMPTGETVSPGLVKRWMEYNPGVKVVNAYGPAEASDDITQYIMEEAPETEVVPIGKPIRNTRIYITDSKMKLCPVGVVGEICVAGAGVGRGYINDPEKTKEVFGQDPYIGQPGVRLYKTGDSGRWLPDGNIEFLGRKDHQVKIRGYRIELGEVEARINAIEGIVQAVVADRIDSGGNRYLCAYYTAEQEIQVTDIKEQLSESLPDYMIPARYMQLEEIPLTQNGKIARSALPEPDKIEFYGEYVAAATEVEEKLQCIWQEVLSIKRNIGTNENFFDLGGHSIKIIALSSRIHKEFNVEVPLKKMFDCQTIKEQAEYICFAGKNQYLSIPSAEEKDFYPISPAQKRLYLLNQLDTKSTGYNMPGTIVFKGYLDMKQLVNVFKTLINRHEALRTSFEIIDNEPVQRINKDIEFVLEEYVLDNGFKDQPENEEQRVSSIVRNFVRPFDISKAPLIRAGLVELSDNRSLMMYDMHHIISDGISMTILEREFVSLYNGQKLPENRLQYRDYSEWQNKMLTTDVIKKQEEYWLKTFSGELQHLNMPTDYTRPFIHSFEGDRSVIRIMKEEIPNAAILMSETRSTLYMLILAVFNVLLSKYSNQEDIVIGSTISGRPHSDLDGIIGMFVNTLAMRNYVTPDKKFYDFLIEVRENTIKAFENQDYPFEELVSKINLKRDLSRNPLFDIVLTMLNIDGNENTFAEIETKPFNYYNRVSQFDIALDAIESDKYIEFCFEYCTDLYRKETIERMAEHLKNIFIKVVKNPDLMVADIDMLSINEKKKILEELNQTESDYYNCTLNELFEAQVQKTPNDMALQYRGEQLTYQQLNQRSNQLAYVLRDRGIKPGECVGIMSKNSISAIVGFIAVLKAGGVYLPMDPEYPDELLRYMLADSNAQILLVQRNVHEKSDFMIDRLIIEDITEKSAEVPYPANINSTDDLAYIIYTSGTTGNPKGVMIKHFNIVNQLMGLKNKFNLDRTLNHMLLGSISFDASIQHIMLPLVTGGKLFIPDRDVILDLMRLKDFIKQYGIDVFDSIPAFMETFIDVIGTEEKLYMKYILLGGEVFSRRLLNKIQKNISCDNIINIYGPTETTINATVYKFMEGDILTSSVPIGKPLPNYNAYILDSHKNLTPVGIPGELHIGGVGLSKGYLNKPELTKERFISNPFREGELLYKTGDIVKLNPDYSIQFIGRKDYQVKIRGYRVELNEIEECLTRHKLIKEAVLVAETGEGGDIMLHAYITSDEKLEIQEIKTYLAEKLPHYKIPSYIIQIERIPLTQAGKVDRSKLPEIGECYVQENVFCTPGNIVEESLLNIWLKILDVKNIGIIDNFFELGGHSLKAAILMSDIQKEFNIRIPMVEIFKKPTIHELAEYIIKEADESKMTGDPNLVLLTKGRNENLHLFIIHDGTGDTESYIKFCSKMGAEVNFWGIRADGFESAAPRYITIEEIAQCYIEKIKTVQPKGPYNIAGWCIGGTIAFEIARQLEAMNDDVGFLSLISSAPPKGGFENIKNEFSLDNEKNYIYGILQNKDLGNLIGDLQDIDQIWKKLLEYIHNSPWASELTAKLKEIIPIDISQAIPHFEYADIKQIAYYTNVIRSFFVARSHYTPANKIKAVLKFFDADRERVIDVKVWNDYCINEIDIISINGDHFSIFKSDEMINFAQIFYDTLISNIAVLEPYGRLLL